MVCIKGRNNNNINHRQFTQKLGATCIAILTFIIYTRPDIMYRKAHLHLFTPSENRTHNFPE